MCVYLCVDYKYIPVSVSVWVWNTDQRCDWADVDVFFSDDENRKRDTSLRTVKRNKPVCFWVELEAEHFSDISSGDISNLTERKKDTEKEWCSISAPCLSMDFGSCSSFSRLSQEIIGVTSGSLTQINSLCFSVRAVLLKPEWGKGQRGSWLCG